MRRERDIEGGEKIQRHLKVFYMFNVHLSLKYGCCSKGLYTANALKVVFIKATRSAYNRKH